MRESMDSREGFDNDEELSYEAMAALEAEQVEALNDEYEAWLDKVDDDFVGYEEDDYDYSGDYENQGLGWFDKYPED